MNFLLAAVVALQLLTGSVTYYGQGVMEATYEKRLEYKQVQPCRRCIGMIATMDSENLGKVAYIKRPGFSWEGPFLIVDCAKSEHRATLKKRGLVAEVDYKTKIRWGRLPKSIKLLIVNPVRLE